MKLTGRTVASKKYVFVPADAGASAPLASPRWTELVKRIFKRHAGVPLAPKNLRSSCVTWLRSNENTDEVLKAAAFAMKHSTAMSAGPAYDKERSERLSSAAIKVVGEHAARF